MLAWTGETGYDRPELGSDRVNSDLPALGDGAGEETFNRACFVLLAGRLAGMGEDVRRRAVPVPRADGGGWTCGIGRRTESDSRCRGGDISASVLEGPGYQNSTSTQRNSYPDRRV